MKATNGIVNNQLTHVPLGTSGLDVFPLALGGNGFGWTSDQPTSFEVLDAYVAAGGNFFDTADAYSAWVAGNSGGESERIIGAWLASRGHRDQMVIATKVGSHPEFRGLSASNIAAAAEASLRRLGTDVIDVYYAHFDDAGVPLEETIEAFSGLVTAGKVRTIGISNYAPERLREWFAIAKQEGFHLPTVLQPHYNILERQAEDELIPTAIDERMAVVPYYSLASGFLTGKYNHGTAGNSPRSGNVSKYMTVRGTAVIEALTTVAADRNTEVATVALAWLRQQDGVVAPISSARSVKQVGALANSVSLDLTVEELTRITSASSN